MCVDGVAKSEGSAEDECQADQNQLEDADKLEWKLAHGHDQVLHLSKAMLAHLAG